MNYNMNYSLESILGPRHSTKWGHSTPY